MKNEKKFRRKENKLYKGEENIKLWGKKRKLMEKMALHLVWS